MSVDLSATPAGVRLEVADNGPGAPEELREAIFVRGFSNKPEVLGGRGIGLPLVQLICAQRGGLIQVRHRDGAVFTVELSLSAVVWGGV